MSMVEYDVRKDLFSLPEKSLAPFISVGFVATTNCNLQCVHCCESDVKQDSVSIQTERQVIQSLARGGTKRMCVTGGEPLMRNDIIDLLKFIHSKKIDITLATNGTRLTKDLLAQIRPFIDNIRFSLHGLELTHDKVAGEKGSFERVRKGIEFARSLDLPIGIISTVMTQNYSDMFGLAKLCEEKGVDVLHFFSLIHRGRGIRVYSKEYVSPARIKQSVEDILNVSSMESWRLRVNMMDWDKEGQCVLVYPNGDMVGSPSFSDQATGFVKKIGNLLKQTPDKLWQAYPFRGNYIHYYKDH